MRVLPGLLLIIAVFAENAAAQTAYSYDALGRLVQARETSDPTKIVKYTYDATDNRTKVKNGNAAPSANNDVRFLMTTGSTWTGTLFVLTNDTDADLPDDTLKVTSTSGSPYASVPGGESDGIAFIAAPLGHHSFSYTMKDANGATSSATVSAQVVYCNPICEL
jgi:hypothetical protein